MESVTFHARGTNRSNECRILHADLLHEEFPVERIHPKPTLDGTDYRIKLQTSDPETICRLRAALAARTTAPLPQINRSAEAA